MRVFGSLAHSIARHPVAIIVAWAVAAAGLYGLAEVGVGDYGNLDDRTTTGPPLVPGSDSYESYQAQVDNPDPNAGDRWVGEVRGVDPADVATRSAVLDAIADLADIELVRAVATPFTQEIGPAFDPATVGVGDASALAASDGDGFLVVVTTDAVDDQARQALDEQIDAGLAALWATISDVEPDASYYVFTELEFFESFGHQVERDLIVGEAIALPLALLVMVLVFGGFLAASTPIIGALASIGGGFAVLYGFTFPFFVDDSALNIVTVLGIGLCIDYGLLIVSRFREELSKACAAKPGGDHRESALETALSTAGRTVFFSAVTVAVAVLGMMTFAPDIMRAFGGAGLGVVVMALLAALTLVPAVMYLYGDRLVRPGLLSRVPGVRSLLTRTSDVEHDEGVFSRLAAWVQRRPWAVLGASAAVLLVLATPALGLTMRNSDVELLPTTDPGRQYLEAFDSRYPPLADPAVDLVAEATPAELDAWAAQLADLEGVTRLDPARELGDRAIAGVHLEYEDGGSPEAVAAVEAIRAADAPFTVYVGGQAANQRDFIDAVIDGLPLAVGLVVGATFILLFLMTGSVLVPVKTLIINTLSLTASVGAMVWIFQEGHLESLLGFKSTGGIETYVVVLIVSFGFGLAMDYEVFLLSRIKELVDRGVPNDEAVRLGLQRSGRIITSAAVIIILVFLGFAAGKVLVIKEVGVGLAFAVFLDATIVRMLLVPASMTLLGQWNWWAPAPLRRLYDRFAITH